MCALLVNVKEIHKALDCSLTKRDLSWF